MSGSPVAEVIISQAGMLVVLLSLRKRFKELVVHRSPMIRNDDKLFQPVASMVFGQCVTVDVKERVKDAGMYLAMADHFVVSVHDECPAFPHICNADPSHVFSLN